MPDFHHLLDNPLIGLALIAVLVLFTVAVAAAIYSSVKNKPSTSPNFPYVATVIAGLVLSVASGVLGTPAKVVGVPANAAVSEVGTTEVARASVTSDQIANFRTLYAWVYVLEGLVCLIVFACPTPLTHELVKGVGLTMLGFLITIVGSIGPAANQINTVGEKMTLHIQQ